MTCSHAMRFGKLFMPRVFIRFISIIRWRISRSQAIRDINFDSHVSKEFEICGSHDPATEGKIISKEMVFPTTLRYGNFLENLMDWWICPTSCIHPDS